MAWGRGKTEIDRMARQTAISLTGRDLAARMDRAGDYLRCGRSPRFEPGSAMKPRSKR